MVLYGLINVYSRTIGPDKVLFFIRKVLIFFLLLNKNMLLLISVSMNRF